MQTPTLYIPRASRVLGSIGVLMGAAACADAPTDAPAAVTSASASIAGFDKPRSVLTRGRIAFTSWVTSDPELYSVNEDGSGLVRLTYSPGADHDPAWSPDGKKIAFVSYRAGTGDLYVMNADGSNTKRITSLGVGSLWGLGRPSWSPDGKRIVFFSFPPGQTDYRQLFIVNANGSNLMQLTTDPVMHTYPAWSPDGTKIAFSRFDPAANTPARIYVMNVDGSEMTPVSDGTHDAFQPAWSPDMKWIAYSGYTTIRKIFLETGYDALVMENASGVAWSPDGVRLVYTSMPAASITRTLTTSTPDGADPKPVVTMDLEALNLDASWGRAP